MRLAIWLLVLMVMRLSAQSMAPPEPLAKAPAKARLKPNPLAGDPNAKAAGQKLFREHCAECHGKDAEGSKKAPMLAGGPMADATPGQIFWILTNGVLGKGMPEWSRLPPQQRWQIVAFLESLNKP
jgi:mono/diheme cytochrome c family protein